MAFSSLVLRHLTSEAERVGIASSHLLTGILAQSSMAGGSFWLPDRDTFEIVDRALRASETPGLGLRLGARGSLTTIGAAGMLLSVAESFRQALRALVHFERLAHDLKSSVLKETETTLTVEFAKVNGPSQFRECMTEFIAINLTTLLVSFAGPSARFTSVLFDYSAPRHIAAYEAAFGCELRFDQPRFALVVDTALADRVQTLSQPALARQLWQLSERELIEMRQLRTIVDDVRDRLRVDSGARLPRIAAVARGLGMSERSLRRRLAEMKVDYRSLVAERQREVASTMLRRPGVSVKEVAHGLGYGPSAFHKAFKRWTGANPSSIGAALDPSGHSKANNRRFGAAPAAAKAATSGGQPLEETDV